MNTISRAKFHLFIFILLFFVRSYSQNSDEFHDLIEKTVDGKIKIYLNDVFKVAYKDCAEYYMIADFDDHLFQFRDSIKIYYKSSDLYLKGASTSGKLNGKFDMYYRNQEKKMSFEYSYGNRAGLWESFSKDGDSIKKVLYENNNEYLLEQRSENGDVLVKNGHGKFNDDIFMSITNTVKSTVIGNVKNGLPDGEWNFYTSNINYGKEYFENYTFKQGVSISLALGNRPYYNNFITTFTGRVFLEHLKIIDPTTCAEQSDIAVSDIFFEKLKKHYYKRKLQLSIPDNWFLVEIETDADKKIIGVSIISKADAKSIALMKELIYDLKKAITFPLQYKPGFDYFPLVIKNSEILTPYDKGTELLEFKY